MNGTTAAETIPVKTIGRWSSYEDVNTNEEAKESAALVLQETKQPNPRNDAFWEYATSNLLESLILYTSEWPPYKRNLGDLHEYLTDNRQLDEIFAKLPPGHCALLPYSAFRMSCKTVRDLVMIGLLCRLEDLMPF